MLYRLLLITVLFLPAAAAQSHPEDEFCTPSESPLDAALCEKLTAMDSAAGNLARTPQPILDEDGNVRGPMSTAWIYLKVGVGHILPGGLDHILFVLALVLTSTRFKSLFIQITTFTVAHTATLGLAAAGVIAPPASIVEPLIAASIAFVAIENLFVKDMPRWRPAVVFMFGLLHGMGFAGFFGELGLPPGQFWSGLIGFNIGVEIGQLSVVALAYLAIRIWQRASGEVATDIRYRRWIVIPGSLLIGLTGLWWAIERTFLT